MKKMNFWMVMFLMGLAAAMWTGCSDDDDENGGLNPNELVKDTTWIMKELKFNDSKNPGFYEKVVLNRTDGKVSEINISKYTPEGTLNGEAIKYSISRPSAKQVVATTTLNGEQQEYLYALNDKGLVTSIKTSSDAEEDAMEYLFSYDASQRLSNIKINAWGEEAVVFSVEYAADGNWQKFMLLPDDGEGEVMTDACNISSIQNNYSLDLNLLTFLKFQKQDVVLTALYMELLPLSPAVLSSVNAMGMEIAVQTQMVGKAVAGIKLSADSEGEKMTMLDMELKTSLK